MLKKDRKLFQPTSPLAVSAKEKEKTFQSTQLERQVQTQTSNTPALLYLI